jgi:hypothetical protein
MIRNRQYALRTVVGVFCMAGASLALAGPPP